MLALFIIAAIVSLLVILAFVRINAVFTLAFEDDIKGMELYIQYLFIKKTLFPVFKEDEKEAEHKEEEEKAPAKKHKSTKSANIKKIYALIRALDKEITGLLNFIVSSAVTIRNLVIEARVGTDDPMLTGIAVGGADAFIYSILGILDNSAKLKHFRIEISPDWNNEVIKGGIFVKVHTNIFNILRLLFRLAVIYVKLRKVSKSL